MNPVISSALIPVVIFLSTAGAIFVLVHLFKFSKKGRRNPLTSQLLRSPGESLRSQIEDLSIDVNSYLTVLFFLPFVIFAIYLSQIYFGGARESLFSIAIYSIAAVSVIGFCLIKIWRLLKKRHDYRLGLDCEMAVGQELNQLMLEGYRVFHDFPVEELNKKFNIDHIVVSPKGVFAIETKGRAKPDKNLGVAEATVVYDGQSLKFPGWIGKDPIEQARGNADWLSKWLGKAVGEAVQVYPVLALPGWYVERQGTGDVYVFNPKNPHPFFRTKGNASLSESLIERISHQLEQKCRDVEPTAYRQAK